MKDDSYIKKVLQDDKKKSTLEEVYKVTKKWLGIKDIDKNRIDIILATAISNQLQGTPIWLFLVGPSGDWKTTFAKSLNSLPNVIEIDQLTKNTLASGKKDAPDLGSTLQNSNHILIFLDLASLTSANKEEKNIIWGQFRTLYDGDIFKKTGSGVNKEYRGCHVTIIACTTESIRDEILIHAQLGTRELMYDTDADPIDNDFKMDKAWENEQYEHQMAEELKEVVRNFIHWHNVKEIEIPDDIKLFLKNEAQRLTVLRAGGAIDRIYKELINPISPEVPSRLIKQLKRIYICLKSLDEKYPDEKAKQIISHIIDSSGDKVRQMVLKLLTADPEKKYRIPDVQQELRLGRNSVKAQLEQLWNIGIVDKEIKNEQIGGYPKEIWDKDLKEYKWQLVGGRFEEVSYYKYNINNKLIFTVTPHLTHSTTAQQSIYSRGVNDG